METFLDGQKSHLPHSLIERLDNGAGTKRNDKLSTNKLKTLDGLIFMFVWVIIALFCVATWYWVIADVPAHLAFLK